jgi:6-phosphofructokinase 1
MATLGILVGGGPAPGINGVIGAATIYARRLGLRVLGVPNGFAPLVRHELDEVRELDIEDVSRIHLLGGSVLHTSRTSPIDTPQDLERTVRSLEELGVDYLLTIGGDGTAHVARVVGEHARERLRLVHVPKTIDNDLPLPPGVPTFGFETAREAGASVVARLMEDARTSSRWYVVVMMGRDAGHLALGVAKAAGATLAVIPEEFARGTPLQRVMRVIEGSILKRAAMGRGHGVAVVAEGIAGVVPESDFPFVIEKDKHGRPRFSDAPLADHFAGCLREGVRELGIKDLSVTEKEVGYELRCAAPNAFDIAYGRDLGAGAVEALLRGDDGVMVIRDDDRLRAVPFPELVDSSGARMRQRLVDTNGRDYHTARMMQVHLEPADLAPGSELCERICKTAGRSADELRARYFG